LIVCRPAEDERESLEQGTLTLEEGLVGDNWKTRGSSSTVDGDASLDAQLTIMNARMIELIAGEHGNWPPAGDQLFLDMDLSDENLPPGTGLSLGTAVLEITPEPHNGCKKFANRYGVDAVKFVNTPLGKQLHLRGIYAKVVQAGEIRVGDLAVKL